MNRPRQHSRIILAGEQGWRCCWCGCRMRLDPGMGDSATREHIIPRVRGGSNHWSNLAAACHRCNKRRREAVGHPDFPEISARLASLVPHHKMLRFGWARSADAHHPGVAA
jgi:5-methylcytosine-specific restriction endonuclease McrA